MQCIAGPPPHSGRGGIGIRLGRGPDLDCNGGATGAGKTDSALPCAFDAVQAKTDAVACGAAECWAVNADLRWLPTGLLQRLPMRSREEAAGVEVEN